jgi:VWFA-related protein
VRQSEWIRAFSVGAALLVATLDTPLLPAQAGQTQAPEPTPALIPRTHAEREQRYQQLHRTLLNMQVTDGDGQPVTGLTEQDFTLLEDGKPRTFVGLKAVSAKAMSGSEFGMAHGIVVLDAVNNSHRFIDSDRREIERYLKERKGLLPYPMAIAVLTESGILTGKTSRDRSFLQDELTDMAGDLHPISCASDVAPDESFLAVWMPGTVSTANTGKQLGCLNQRFIDSLTSLEHLALRQMDVPGRAIVIWIGPGWPLLQNKQFRPDDAAVKQDLFTHLVEVSDEMREAQITLDMILPPSQLRGTEPLSDQDSKWINGVPQEEDVRASSLGLQVLAHQTGGKALIDSKDIPDGIAAVMADAQSYYVLSFDSTAANGPDEFHSLEVKVNRPGATVRTYTMYYAEQ